jgi:5'-phosphate synthase pdxT subunit
MTRMSTLTVGVLALQGAFSEHIQLLRHASAAFNGHPIQWKFIEVRTAEELHQCDALIIPGGESTTISLIAARNGLLDQLRDFVKYGSSVQCIFQDGLMLSAELREN